MILIKLKEPIIALKDFTICYAFNKNEKGYSLLFYLKKVYQEKHPTVALF